MRYANFVVVSILLAFVAGCGDVSVEVVDLNKVLDIFDKTLTELDKKEGGEEAEVAEVKAGDEKEGKRKEFLDLYAKNLNAAKLIKSKIGVQMEASGDVIGFKDGNGNNVKDSIEKKIFTVMIDTEGGRLIAKDEANHHRDHRYRPRGGFFTGYLIGSMMGRNRSYYSGARAATKPNYKGMTMSPKNYHSQAVSKAKAKARSARSSSARSRSGSRGMSFGK